MTLFPAPEVPFQPTLPARGATASSLPTGRWASNFNPRSPHGERRRASQPPPEPPAISTHAPRTGSDQLSSEVSRGRAGISTHAPRTGSDEFVSGSTVRAMFISTHAPRTGSDEYCQNDVIGLLISTHAPRTGSDSIFRDLRHLTSISTHAPRTGSDPCAWSVCRRPPRFQPTLPARGATPW